VITCSEAVRRLWAYLEDEVSAADRAAIEAHLDVCRRCCGELEFAGELRAFLGRSAALQLPEEVRARMAAFLDGMATDHG
jgi:mycothiol system anti-sigma-R factor